MQSNRWRGAAAAISLATLVMAVPATAQDAVTLTHWYYDFPPFADYQRQRIESFQAENPGITVEFDSSIPPVGEGGYEDKITSSLATGTAPDVFSVISPQALRIIDLGQLAPIDEAALAALGFDSLDALRESRYPGAFDAWTDADGNIYGIPDAISFYSLYCNNDHLAAGGVDPATVDITTWDDFIAMGKAVIEANPSQYKDANGTFVKNFIKLPMYQDDTWSMQTLTQFLAQSGGSVLSADGATSTLNAPEGVAAVEKMMQISRELGDPNIGPVVPGEIHAAVASGDQTCGLAGEWMYGAFLKPTNSPLLDHYTAFKLPRLDADRPGNVFWGWSFVVNAASANKDAAWKYIGHLTADPNGIVENVGIWPPVPAIEELQGVKDTPFGDVIAANREGGQHIFKTLKYTDVARVLRGRLEAMAFEGLPVQATLDEAVAEINDILSQ
jgi:lactose/L-arabinose transport system substrate-binding protein